MRRSVVQLKRAGLGAVFALIACSRELGRTFHILAPSLGLNVPCTDPRISKAIQILSACVLQLQIMSQLSIAGKTLVEGGTTPPQKSDTTSEKSQGSTRRKAAKMARRQARNFQNPRGKDLERSKRQAVAGNGDMDAAQHKPDLLQTTVPDATRQKPRLRQTTVRDAAHHKPELVQSTIAHKISKRAQRRKKKASKTEKKQSLDGVENISPEDQAAE